MVAFNSYQLFLSNQTERNRQTNINYASANLRYNVTFYNHIFLLRLEHDITMYSSVVPSWLPKCPEEKQLCIARSQLWPLTDCYPIHRPLYVGSLSSPANITSSTPCIFLYTFLVEFLVIWLSVQFNMI